MKSLLRRFVSDEQGLETIEYAIIAGMIVVISIATIGAIGLWVNDKFTQVLEALNGGGQ